MVQPTPQSGSVVIAELTVSCNRKYAMYENKAAQVEYVNPQEHNRYSYVLNNPLKYRDPTGRIAIVDDVTFWTMVGVGAGATFFYFYATSGSRVKAAASINILISNVSNWFNQNNPFKDNKNKNNITNKREDLLKRVKNEDLKTFINENFRLGATIGDGSSWAAYLEEGSHIQKVQDSYIWLEKMLTGNSLETTDRIIAEQLFREITNALEAMILK